MESISLFAERFKELLARKNLTQKEFSAKYNVAQKTVNHWCLGHHYPEMETLIFICKELGEKSDFLLGIEKEC